MPIADFSLANKVAIVTGASRGIGEAIARGMAEYGATVVLASRKQDALDAVAASIAADGGTAIPIACHRKHERYRSAVRAGQVRVGPRRR